VALAFGLAVGILVSVWTLVLSFQGRHVPAWAVIISPLWILVTARRTLRGLTMHDGPEVYAMALGTLAEVGALLVVLGGLSVVAGVLGVFRQRGAPALVQIGSWMMIGGLVGSQWASAQAAMWLAWDLPVPVLSDLQALGTAKVQRAMTQSVWIGLLIWLPSVVWGYRRERFVGQGEAVAAIVLLALTASTGTPAAEAIDESWGRWASVCTELRSAGAPVRASSDGQPTEMAALVRLGSEVEGRQPEVLMADDWVPDQVVPNESWWILDSSLTVRDFVAVAGPNPIVAVATDSDSERDHPALRAARCRPVRLDLSQADPNEVVRSIVP